MPTVLALFVMLALPAVEKLSNEVLPSAPMVMNAGPLLMIVEAKKQDFDEGLPQCAAQLLGSRKFNEKHGNPDRTLYGSVTTGSEWQFLRLIENEIQINPDRYHVSNLSQILGVLVAILKGSTKP